MVTAPVAEGIPTRNVTCNFSAIDALEPGWNLEAVGHPKEAQFRPERGCKVFPYAEQGQFRTGISAARGNSKTAEWNPGAIPRYP
jgi:hypothetical protein